MSLAKKTKQTTIENPFLRVLGGFSNQAKMISSFGRDEDEVETLQIILNSVRRFGKNIDSSKIDETRKIPPEMMNKAKKLGLFGLTIDQQYGGADLSLKGACRVIEELGRINCSFGVTVGLHCGLAMRGLNYYASSSLQQKYLPDLSAGKKIAAFSITEPEAGSDIASLRTTAIQKGDKLVINGSKCFVTNGNLASVATIVARSPGLGGTQRGHSMILVPLDLPGVSREPEENKLGLKGSSTCTLNFDDVEIDSDHLIGTPAAGLNQMNHVLSWGRTLMASGCIGVAKDAYQRTLEHVTSRRQFNRVIVEFGMVQEKIAAMRAGIHACESLIRLTTQLEDEKPGSFIWESTIAKIFCSETAWAVADEAVQLHGGSGYIEDTGVARLLRDIRITRIFEGTNELMRFHLASGTFAQKTDQLLDAPTLKAQTDPQLSDMAAVFDQLLQRLATTLNEQKKKYGLKVFKRQMTQKRIADATSAIYVILALLARAQGEIDSNNFDDSLLSLTRYAVQEQTVRFNRCLEDMANNSDDFAGNIAAQECQKAGYCIEENMA